jgi:ElaB/YqjD/DUF883 family membrane-anchored ribosome-binding protein
MAENVRSSDIPNFDTYPSSPPAGTGVRSRAGGGSTLEQRAADLGAAAGQVVRMLRQARETLGTLPDMPGFDRLSGLAENARARAEQLRSMAAHGAEQLTRAAKDKTIELKSQVRETTAELGRRAKSNYYRTRLRAQQTVREYPVHVAVAAGAVGFLVGVALRIRRANRAY